MNRRCFLRNATAGAIALQSFPYHLFATGTKKYATDRIKLGPKGVEVSRLAMGSGTDGVGGSSNQTRKLGLQGLANLFDAAYDQGVTFWASADQHGTHPNVHEALERGKRERLTILRRTLVSPETTQRTGLAPLTLSPPPPALALLIIHTQHAISS